MAIPGINTGKDVILGYCHITHLFYRIYNCGVDRSFPTIWKVIADSSGPEVRWLEHDPYGLSIEDICCSFAARSTYN